MKGKLYFSFSFLPLRHDGLADVFTNICSSRQSPLYDGYKSGPSSYGNHSS